MLIATTHNLARRMDGIQLSRFTPGYVHHVGTSLGCYWLAVGAQPAIEKPFIVTPLRQVRPSHTDGVPAFP
jgi:hypothetical protein